MKNVDWMYHRKSCETCRKSDDFFSKNKVKVTDIVDAKSAYQLKQAMEIVESVDRIFATKGTKVRFIDLKADKPSKAEIEDLVIGPTGKLRAPTIKVGRTLVVGFNESTYNEVLSN